VTALSLQRRFEEILAGIRQPARLIGDEPGSGPGFSGDPAALRVVLGFPDTYEIGISNQAIQILYHLAANVPGVECERVYLPWVDAAEAMRRKNVPLLTLESWTPVATADVLAVTLQHELHFTSVLELLDLAGVAFRAGLRGEADPLVVGGGPACANFLPMSRFFDAIAVGDGEEVWPEILGELTRAKKEGAARDERKRRLSRLQGVFVPGMSGRVRRRVLPRLEGAPYPSECLVPLTAGVHDRAWVEVMRGCTRGCRFCQAGMWYRPVRERTPQSVLALAGEVLTASGHQELAFASLSTTDYSALEEVLVGAAAAHPDVRVSLPSLRVDSAAVRLAHLASPTGPSLTLAPEAGSQRMRDVINKNVSEDDVLAAAEEAFRGGRTTLKLYFMIGLPLEEDDDVAALAELCLRIREEGRRALGSRAGRLQLNVSVNYFVPKPFTPFQWKGMADRETLLRRRELLYTRLRKSGIKLAMPDVGKSYLEAALSRGGESLGEVIEEAWRKGARFDSWTEQFRPQVWREAFTGAGLSIEALATEDLAPDRRLPWDIIDGVVDKAFLWSEWQAAAGGAVTADCRWSGCSACGACDHPPGNDLAAVGSWEPRVDAAPPGGGTTRGEGNEAAAAARPAAGYRYLAGFSVRGRGRFLGHLDRTEVFRRAVRRAGGRPALSAGMRPKALLSLALPLAVGVESTAEWCEFELAEEPPPGFAHRLARSLPGHMTLTSLERRPQGRWVAAQVAGASYEVVVKQAGDEAGAARPGDGIRLEEAARRFARAVQILVEHVREGRVRQVDVKRYVEDLEIEAAGEGLWRLRFRAAVTPAGTARPESVVRALGMVGDLALEIAGITRTGIHLTTETR
jgi:radical SAM-linked protein